MNPSLLVVAGTAAVDSAKELVLEFCPDLNRINLNNDIFCSLKNSTEPFLSMIDELELFFSTGRIGR